MQLVENARKISHFIECVVNYTCPIESTPLGVLIVEVHTATPSPTSVEIPAQGRHLVGQAASHMVRARQQGYVLGACGSAWVRAAWPDVRGIGQRAGNEREEWSLRAGRDEENLHSECQRADAMLSNRVNMIEWGE